MFFCLFFGMVLLFICSFQSCVYAEVFYLISFKRHVVASFLKHCFFKIKNAIYPLEMVEGEKLFHSH